MLGGYYNFRDYYAALLRTQESFVAPTQGQLLNYVQRVPLGVVAQITVCFFCSSFVFPFNIRAATISVFEFV